MVLEGSERELIDACRRGERDAFRALFETYKNRVYSVALRFAGNQATAMDIAQDTFQGLAAWKSQDQVYALACSNPVRPQAACLLCHTSL